MYILVLLLLNVQLIKSLELDRNLCGTEPDGGTKKNGTQYVHEFPWLGILYHTFVSDVGEDRATTMVVLIHQQFVLGSASDISSIPRRKLRTNTKVFLGKDWESEGDRDNPGYRVLSYIVHPEYNVDTMNALAIVKLETSVENVHIWTVCPPETSHQHKQPFSVIIEDVNTMARIVREMMFVNKYECIEYYKYANLSYPLMWPTQPLCAVAVTEKEVCVWEGGYALASRDSWGRWHLLGFGVRGPGCGAPSRYLNIFRYLPWIEDAFESSQGFTISRKSPNTLYLRQGRKRYKYKETNRVGDCDPMDRSKMVSLFEERSDFQIDQLQPVSGHYKFVLVRTGNYTCIIVSTLGAINAIKPRIWVENICPKAPKGTPCHIYVNSTGTIRISFVFTFKMTLVIKYIGFPALDNKTKALPDALETKELVLKQWREMAI